MARPKKAEAPDLSHAQDLAAGLIERMACPAGQALPKGVFKLVR